ncbi:unnamed protein product [Lathyrus sativus]|nr:unnamed protein product [Lathyrus sativus]
MALMLALHCLQGSVSRFAFFYLQRWASFIQIKRLRNAALEDRCRQNQTDGMASDLHCILTCNNFDP